MLWTRMLQSQTIIPGTCCICSHVWEDNQPAQNFNTYVYQDELDSGECLGCHNASRHRIMHNLEMSGAFNFANKNILFFSPHSGYEQRLVEALRQNNKVHVSDPENGNDAWNIECLPCSSNSFDVVFCIHVLEHIEKDLLAIAELHRVLKHNGVLVIGVPHGPQENTLYVPEYNTPELRRLHYYYHDHKRLYGKEFVRDYLKMFDVKSLDGSMIKDFARSQRIPWTEAIHLARKR